MKFCFTLLFGLFSVLGYAQELNVDVSVNTPQLRTVDPKVFESLETSIQEFMNNRKWTNDVFEPEERIQVSLQITITKENSPTSFEADFALQSTRPIYNSDQNTPVFTHVDGITFNYEQFQPLEYSENQFDNNLVSVLAFYTYIILGLDYDSFGPFGGEQYLQKAQEIVTNIPPAAAATYKGWRSVDGNRNRYWIIENLLTPRARNFRQANYEYHRQGLDLMSENAAAGRALVLAAIQKIGDMNRNYPNSMIVQIFGNTKRDEIIEIFKAGSLTEQNEMISTMIKLDPADASKYRAVK